MEATAQPENEATITRLLEHFQEDFTIQEDMIPITFHNAIGAITDPDTMGFVMPYAEIAARIKVYYVKGYNTARFSLESRQPFDHFEIQCAAVGVLRTRRLGPRGRGS